MRAASLCLVSPITTNSTEERKEERKRGTEFSSHVRVASKESSSRVVVDPLVTRYCLVNLASCLGQHRWLFLPAWHLVRSAFPSPPLSLSLLVPSVQLSVLLFFLQRGENARIPRGTAVSSCVFSREWNHACGLLNLFVFFFPLSFLPPHRWNNSNDQSSLPTFVHPSSCQCSIPPIILLSRERRLKSTVETTVAKRWVRVDDEHLLGPFRS